LGKQIENTGNKTNISEKSNTLSNNDHMGCYFYKIRHLIENTFARLKQFKVIAIRYDKLAQNFLSAIYLASTIIWLN